MKRWFYGVGIVLMGTNIFMSSSCLANEIKKGDVQKVAVQGVNISDYVVSVDKIKVDPSIKIVGLGEATHGNAELQKLKENVFKALVNNNGCKIFAIEGDFGGAQKVNEYINGATGTAYQAVEAIGFKIYDTEEMVHLVQWMREYNAQVEEGQKLKFYGFDMQRYTYNKTYALEYLKKVDEKLATTYENLLIGLSDDKKLSYEETKKALETIETLLSMVNQNKEQYIKKTNQKDFDFAYQCIGCLREKAHLELSGMNYNELRDSYMAEKVKWIYNYENQQMIFINGHNGHISKTSDGLSYHNMGSRLREIYNSEYYSIGTDMMTTQFNATNNDKMEVFKITNSNGLVNAFSSLKENECFMDLKIANKNKDIATLLNTKQPMLSIGSSFGMLHKMNKAFYTSTVKPVEAYDGIILLKECTPTTYWE